MDTGPSFPDDAGRLLRIQEVASNLGLTTRRIRYYEEVGLLAPAARSEGAYRLYDADDVERLRYIRGLRDDAGFSLAEIARFLEDEQARRRNRAKLRAIGDPAERAAIMTESIERLERQIATLGAKIERLEAMVVVAQDRRARLIERRAQIDAECSGIAMAADPEAR